MLNPDRAFDQFKAILAGIGIKKLADLRPLSFVLNFTVPATADLAAPTTRFLPQLFPAGAVILGIKGDCFPEGQPVNPFLIGNERFRVRLSYNTSDGLVTNFGIAQTIFGRENDEFPQRALFLEANQVIQTEIQNLTPEQIRVDIAFHCLVWRYAQ